MKISWSLTISKHKNSNHSLNVSIIIALLQKNVFYALQLHDKNNLDTVVKYVY